MEVVRVLGIPGSLRRKSYNLALLQAAREMTPVGMTIDVADLSRVPLYNADVEEEGDPRPVQELKAGIASADGLLIATPEYQHGVPGVLKNALDWASRPPGDSVLRQKPVAIVGATPGFGGTARAQSQLRQTLVYNDCFVLGPPEVLVADAYERFDEHGRLSEDASRGFLEHLLERFHDWILTHAKAPALSS